MNDAGSQEQRSIARRAGAQAINGASVRHVPHVAHVPLATCVSPCAGACSRGGSYAPRGARSMSRCATVTSRSGWSR
jgi:hypothetical protein